MLQDASMKSIIDGFEFSGQLIGCAQIREGHINATYRLDYSQPDGAVRSYVLQKINTFAFHHPEQVMQNIQLVTGHLRQAMIARGEDPENRVLHVVPVKGGGVLLLDDQGGSWRAYDFIVHAVSVDRVDSPATFREIGRAFGRFQSMLSDFPIEKLFDTIPDFHDTRKRLEAFEASVARDSARRAASVQKEIAFVRSRAASMIRIVEMIEAGDIPLRVTHNDTKINNVMLDADSGEALCVIDLDTVMAGSSLYDFGDAIRYGASTAAEDETDLNKVALDLNLFSAFSEGFIQETAHGLTETELRNLPLGALVMTYENGMRFLTDYLDGDVYYHIDHSDHNLVRARAQFRLLESMEAHRQEMDTIVLDQIACFR